MNRLLLDGVYCRVRLLHVRMAFSEKIGEVTEFKWSKIAHLFSVIARIIHVRIRSGARTIYFPPASPNMVPFLRDCVILISTRWLFRRTVFHFHANGISELYPRLRFPLRFLYRLAYSNPDLCICLTKYGTTDAKHIGAKKIKIVPNGIPDAVRNVKRGTRNAECFPTILFLAAVSQEKGAGIFLDALSILASRKLSFRGVIAGPFASVADELCLRELAATRHLDDIVEWRGPLSGDEKWATYGGADIFCFPSHYSAETFGLVLVEAMMFSLPIVSTIWRGIPDVVMDGTTGFLVPTHDPTAVADRLEQLINDQELRNDMGRAGRRRYEENFTLEKFREKMESVLEECQMGARGNDVPAVIE
ncbi:MAG: glycosyltransferase family 4 protein [Verrucomicrobiae bacterium]